MAAIKNRRLDAFSLSSARLALVAGAAVSLGAPLALAGPQGEQVVRGNVRFTRDGARTVIHAGHKSIIKYNSFDIASGETVQFIQPGARSRVLNRIDGAGPTRIDGALLANGQVYIVNPAGVVFGAGGVVNVGGLYAGAAHISDSDFLRGVNRFTSASGDVTNLGQINAGAVHLIGRHVANHGAIVADSGVVTMLSGSDILIGERGGAIFARIDGADLGADALPAQGDSATPAPDARPGVENTGSIRARRGRVTLAAGDAYSLAIRNSGTVNAAGGAVSLAAADGLVHNQGALDASVDTGRAGSVTVRGPAVLHEGLAAADSKAGRAGAVEITSNSATTIAAGAVVSVAGGEGRASGGTALVHSYRGDTLFSPGAVLDLSGGALGGDGGVAEISAGARLGVHGEIKADVARGFKSASILFDPVDIIISVGPDSGPLDEPFRISPDTIESTAADVTLLADNNILVLDNINKTNGALSLFAGNDILLSGESGGFLPDIQITATALEFEAGASIVDRSPMGATLTALTGDVLLTALTGAVDLGLANVRAEQGDITIAAEQGFISFNNLATLTDDRTITLTQFDDFTVGPGEFGGLGVSDANREATNLVVTVLGGQLIFGDEFGGFSDTHRLRSVTGFGETAVRIEGEMIVGDFAQLSSNGDIRFSNSVVAQSAIDIHAGMDGSGQVQFLESGLDLGATSIALRAGNSAAPGGAIVDALTNAPSFRSAALGATRPDAFTFEHDAAVTDANLPDGAQFGAPVAGMQYSIRSYGASVAIDANSTVDGSALALQSATGAFLNDALALASLDVIGPAFINGGFVTTTGAQTYSGPVTLGDDTELTGSTVAFNGALDGAFALDITGDAAFAGPVGATARLDSLAVSGATQLAAGLVSTTGDQIYTGPVTLGAHTMIRSADAGDIRFNSTINGAFDLDIQTTPGGLIVFGGDVGASQALRDLRLSTAGPAGHGARPVPDRATIVGLDSTAFFTRDFIMERKEKFTALGGLFINASRHAALGDLVARSDLRVTAPDITLLRREAANITTFTGASVTDRGLDFVAGGVVEFNGAVALGGDPFGPAPTFASGVGVFNGPGIESFELSNINPQFVSEQRLMLEGAVLDQRTQPGSAPPDDGDLDPSAELAGASHLTPRPVFTVLPEAYNVDLLRSTGIAARDVRRDEAIAGVVTSRSLYNDLPPTAEGFDDAQLEVAATRFDIDQVAPIVALHDQLFIVAGPDQVSADLGGAMRGYTTLNHAAEVDPVAFRAFLESQPDQSAALAHFNDLERLLARLRALGLTQPEYRQTRDRILAAFAARGLTVDLLARLLEPAPAPPAPAATTASR